MELELSRVDYTIVGLTATKCMRLLPSDEPKKHQKVVVADQDGILQVFSIKKEEMVLQFKTLPGSEINCLDVCGVPGAVSDKIFVASENEVRGYTKKGKLFFNLDSNMTEPIMSMFVFENDIIVCGRHVYNHFKNAKEIGAYLCGDTILDVVGVHFEKSKRLASFIACEGRMIRVLEHSRVIHSIPLENSPVVLNVYYQDGCSYVLFGTEDGRVGIIDTERSLNEYRWLIQNRRSSSKICCIDSYDISGDGVQNVIIGREEGFIEVYNVTVNDVAESSVRIFLHDCQESVTSVQGGVVANNGYDEVLVCTYTGRIFGLTTEIVNKSPLGDNTSKTSPFSTDTSSKIVKLKSEVEDLEQKIKREREKYQLSTQLMVDGVSAIPLLNIKESMTLLSKEVAYCISIEAPTAIDHVLFQSDVPVDIIDVDKNSAVTSFSECDKKNGNYLLATYRCQTDTNRLDVKVRTVEGQYGTIQAYITPNIQPKCSQLKQYSIKPLSLHTRLHESIDNRPLNTLTFKGSFSLAEIHSWIFQSFPEAPEKPQLTEKSVLTFVSCFIGTVVVCTYGRGEAEFRSDSVSTISILKEFLTKEAIRKKVKLDILFHIDDNTIPHVLKLLDPILIQFRQLQNDVEVLTALEDLDLNDEAIKCISAKYQSLLENKSAIRDKFRKNPSYLERLYGAITDLYMDYNKFKGVNAKSKLPLLLEVIDKYNYDDLVEFFLSEKPNDALDIE